MIAFWLKFFDYYNNKQSDITLAKYNQIKVGMTYSQVVNILGSNGTLTAETARGKVYHWDQPGKSIIISFYDNEVDTKSQNGLK